MGTPRLPVVVPFVSPRKPFTVLACLLACASPVLAQDAGYALRFDGTTDLVRLAETNRIMSAGWQGVKTVSLWLKPAGSGICTAPAPTHCDAIIGDRPRWWGISRGVINGVDRIWVWNYDGVVRVVPVEYTSGEWVHITLVHGGGRLEAYKNGVLVGATASGPTQQPAIGGQPVLHVGGIINNASRNWTFEGAIDEVRFWDLARTAAEISDDMSRELTGTEPGLAAYYQMSDGGGTGVTDDSGRGWHGEILDGAGFVPPDGPAEWIASDAFGDPGGGGGGEPNTRPVAQPQSLQASEDQAVAITLAGTDDDGDELTFQIATPPGHGVLTGLPPMVTYVPHTNYAGADSFSFVVNDGHANSTAALVALTIAPVNDAPVAQNDLSTTSESTAVQVAVLANDLDPDGDLLVVTAVGSAAHGTASHDGVHVTYAPEPAFTGSDSFSYTVRDPAGAEAIATVAVTVTASGNPIELGAFDTPGNAHDVAVAIGLAYVADQSGGLQIIDVTDPRAPFRRAALATRGGANGVALSGSHAFVANGINGLRVIDVSDPGRPIEVAFWDTPGFAQDVEVHGLFAFVADREGGVSIVDVADPLHPLGIGLLPVGDQALDVAVSGTWLFVAAYGRGLVVADITNPAQPFEAAVHRVPHYLYGVVVRDGLAFTASGDGGLSIIDVTTPGTPRSLGAFNTPGFSRSVAVSGTRAYVADWAQGVRVVDVSAPAAPVDIGFMDTAGRTRDVVVADGFLYLADFEGGLRILTP
jgi:hypothetical protein